MSGQEARVWPIDDGGLVRGEVIASAAGVRVSAKWHGRPFLDGPTEWKREYDVAGAEKMAKSLQEGADILREAAAAARKLGAK